MGILIDSETLHPSTRLALTALEWLEDRVQPQNILDIGCGNGILSLTAHHIWGANVLACDTSEAAIKDCRANIAQFAEGSPITPLRSDGVKHPNIKKTAPYQLIIGNLLAQWQVAMAKDLQNLLAEGGSLLLSGILQWQKEGIIDAFTSLNLHIIQEFNEGEWCCVVVGTPRSFTKL